jgi:hypothetical protein
LVTRKNGSTETKPVHCYYDDKITVTRINQNICDRFKLKPATDGFIHARFQNKDRKKNFQRKCVVVPDGAEIPDVVFGKEPPKPAKKPVEQSTKGIVQVHQHYKLPA